MIFRSTIFTFLLFCQGASFLTIQHPSKQTSINRRTSILFSTAIINPNKQNTSSSNNYGRRIPIDESFQGLEKIYSNPDIFIIKDFLDKSSCQDLINKATEKKLDQSPVAYAGKTDDKNELLGLAAKGPVVWLSVLTAWYQSTVGSGDDLMQFGLHVVESYAVFFLLAFAGITAFINTREDELQSLRTSTSTTLDNLDESNGGTGEDFAIFSMLPYLYWKG